MPEFAEGVIFEPLGEGLFVETAEDGSSVLARHRDDVFGFELAEQRGGLGGDDHLDAHGGFLEEAGEDFQGVRVETEFGFINDDGGRGIGLEERGGEADEAKCAVGKVPGLEGEVAAFLPPVEGDFCFVAAGSLFEEEIVEEGGDDADGVADEGVFLGMVLPQFAQEGCDVCSIGAEIGVVFDCLLASHWGEVATVMKVVDSPSG